MHNGTKANTIKAVLSWVSGLSTVVDSGVIDRRKQVKEGQM